MQALHNWSVWTREALKGDGWRWEFELILTDHPIQPNHPTHPTNPPFNCWVEAMLTGQIWDYDYKYRISHKFPKTPLHFLATLGALHFTPFSYSLGKVLNLRSFEACELVVSVHIWCLSILDLLFLQENIAFICLNWEYLSSFVVAAV